LVVAILGGAAKIFGFLPNPWQRSHNVWRN
jgi:hypothetical protein